MKVSEIIDAVRLCLDEEVPDKSVSNLADVSNNDSTYMDDIIKGKVGDALRWCCVNAPADMLYGSDKEGTDPGIIKLYTSATTGATNLTTDGDIGKITLPTNFIKLSRLRAGSWHRAVLNLAEEDSDEYAMMYDATEKGTVDLPRAGISHTNPVEIHFQPYSTGDTFEISYVADPTASMATATDATEVALPPKIKTSLIYYIAYLVMTAYENVPKANACYQVAVQNLGLKQDDNG